MRPVPVLALIVCGACRSTGVSADPDRSTEWVTASAGGADRRPEQSDSIDDGLALAMGGGVELLQGPVDLSWEVELIWSHNDVRSGVTYGDDPHLAVWRAGSGLRLDVTLGESPLSVYGRGGILWRAEHGQGVATIGNNQACTYLGAGLEWWFSRQISLGPFALYLHGEEDGLEEWIVGLSARFHIGE